MREPMTIGQVLEETRTRDLQGEIWASAIATKQRLEAEAARRGMTYEDYLAARAVARARGDRQALRAELDARLGDDRRRIQPEDVDIVLDPDETLLASKQAWREVRAWWLGVDLAGSPVTDERGRALRPRPFVILIGEKGCGKTVASCALKAREGGFIIDAHQMARAWKNETDEARALRDRILGTRLLIVDDVGLERDRDAGFTALQAIVNDRQGGGMRTIVSSNLPWSMNVAARLAEFKKRAGVTEAQVATERRRLEAIDTITSRYDSRTTDRLMHGGKYVAIADKDMRRKSS